MSQLFDYFVCSRSMIRKWAAAMEEQDEELQQRIESKMPRLHTLDGIGQDEFNILAGCAEGDEMDPVEAVGQVDLVATVSEEEGPWVMAFSQVAVEAIAGMHVGSDLIQRWASAVIEFHGTSEYECRELLTMDAANSLKELCGLAVEKQLGVFTCYYG